MKIVFFGTADFGIPSLAAITASARHQIVAAVTGPDKPRGRGLESSPTPIAAWFQSHSPAAVFKPTRLTDPAFITSLNQIQADVYVVIAFRILPEPVYTIPRYAFNLHASLLPAYRGAAPIQRAIMAGEKQTGVTTFLLQKFVDAGPIIGQSSCEIPDDATSGDMFDALSHLGASLVIDTLDRLETGIITPLPQDDSKASPAPKLTEADFALRFGPPEYFCLALFTDSAIDLKNRVRALAPRPGATAIFRENPMKILALLPRNDASLGGEPGAIVAIDRNAGPIVQTGAGQVTLAQVQPAGKRPMTGAEFTRGYHPEIGEVFQTPRLKTI